MPSEDPKQKLTRWLTDVPEYDGPSDDAGTRLMSKEQKAFYNYYKTLYEVLNKRGINVPILKTLVDRDERMMMAYQGRRSDDVVEALRSVKQEEKINSGVQPLTQELARRNYKTED